MSNLADIEREKKRNVLRMIDQMSDLILKRFSHEGEGLEMVQENTEEVARSIVSEVIGINTANLEEPVNDEYCKKAEDILAQIRSRSAKHKEQKAKQHTDQLIQFQRSLDARQLSECPDVPQYDANGNYNPHCRNEVFDDFGSLKQDPFEYAMQIVEK